MPFRLRFVPESGSGREVLEFRRDIIASDPEWTAMRLRPRPDDPASEQYLVLEFDAPPPAEQLRDLRYVAARNRLSMTEQPD